MDTITQLRQIHVDGQTFEMRSLDGKSWFSRPFSLLAASRRTITTPKFTEREIRWLDMLEDAPSAIDSASMKGAIRFHFASSNAEVC